jgi:hypothetical protein
VIETRPGGYVLHAAPDVVDAHRFEAAAEAGRHTLVGDVAAARERLDAALRLWRGPAFEGLCHIGRLAAEAARLEERRLEVLELRLAADLALGEAGW